MSRPITEIKVLGRRDSFGRTSFLLTRHVSDAPIYQRNAHGTMIETGRGLGRRGQVFNVNLYSVLRRERKAGRKVIFKR